MINAQEELPKGFTCECGVEYRFPLYVYAHWRTALDFTCPECKRSYTVITGNARLKKEKSSS